MKIGTRSLLYGVHCVIIHPIFVAIAWIKLYGFPRDIRIWVAFIVHDWGYWSKNDMDGTEGETHVILGAKIMHYLFDKRNKYYWTLVGGKTIGKRDKKWHDFCLYHSRFYAKLNNAQYSKLCVADKYAFVVEPKWIYIPRAILSKEIYEYMGRDGNSRSSDVHVAAFARYNFNMKAKLLWYNHVKKYMAKWVEEHKEIKKDNWS